MKEEIDNRKESMLKNELNTTTSATRLEDEERDRQRQIERVRETGEDRTGSHSDVKLLKFIS